MKCRVALALLLACDPTSSGSAVSGSVPVDVSVPVPRPSDSGAADGGAPNDAGEDRSAGTLTSTDAGSYGTERAYTGAICSYLLKGNFRVAERDLRTSFVDGDDPLALVNRSPTGALPPDYAPSDLISFSPRKPRTAHECESLQCLRKDAMDGYDALIAAMKAAGFQPSLQSAYRSYKAQCGTFGHWAGASSACKATQQSALPGHSQHQLGTVVDLFTEAWRMSGPGVFRHGFGCNKAGEFIRDEAWKYGWVVSYPIHPDDRQAKQPCEPRFDLPVSINAATGYGHEAWHIRFLGVEHARAFHEAASHDETVTLEQWLRAQQKLPAAIATELPVCDGCNCGACASLAPDAGPCQDALPVPAAVSAPAPALVAATWTREGDHVVVKIQVRVEAGVTTQPPLFRAGKPGYLAGESFEHVASVAGGGLRSFPDAAGTVRVAARSQADAGSSWPYRVALPSSATTTVYDRANVVLPASAGAGTVVLVVPDVITEVALLQDGRVLGTLVPSETPAGPAN